MQNPSDNELTIHAAEYVRMSTDQQRYSVANQRESLRNYAAANNMTIVASYADEGISGLTYERRPGLQALVRDVEAAQRDFDTVLVFDVSRWGRFQDADEAAFYEYLMRRAGVKIVYCAEPFDNDGSPLSTIVKSVKRAMAAEYSRELSLKVAAGQRRMAERGYRVGSHAGYGLRRVAVSECGTRRVTLQRGERKATHSDRIVLEPGPPDEVKIVRRIFVLYVQGRLGPQRIAKQLTAEGAPLGALPHWYPSAIEEILRNEKYIGVNIFGKQTFRLRGKRVDNLPEAWVRIEGAFAPIVDRAIFDAAQNIRQSTVRTYSNDDLLAGLRRLQRRFGVVTGRHIQADPELPSIFIYRKRFGTLSRAYRLATLPCA